MEDEVCQCFPGFHGKKCQYIETLEKMNHVEMDIFWGVTGIDRDAADEAFPSGKPIFDETFDIANSPEAQIYMRDACDLFRNASKELSTFPDGSDWLCPWEVFDAWLVSSTGSGLPLDADTLAAKFAGDVNPDVPGTRLNNGFFSKGFVRINGLKVAAWKYKPYVGLNMNTGEIKWTRIGVDTTLEDTMDAVKAEGVHKAWKSFLGKMQVSSELRRRCELR